MKYIKILILTFILLRCANPVSPTGGEKDVNPPVILNVDSTSKKGVVSIYFDENIKFQNNIQLNPTKGYKKAKVEVENKSLHIEIEEYTKSIAFNDAISDLNENNAGKYPFVLLSNDSSRIIVRYQNNQNQKIKVNGYIERDSLMFLADNSRKEELRFEGIPTGTHKIIIYSDDNKNNSYDESESYSIAELSNSDSFFTYLYPPKKETVYQLKKDTEQYSYLATNSYKIREQINQITETKSHLDTIMYLTKDSAKVKDVIRNHIIKKLSLKKVNQSKSTPYIYIDGKDTMFQSEYTLFYVGSLKHPPLQNYSKRESNNYSKSLDTSEKNYRKLGKLIFKNDSNVSFRLILYKGKVELINAELIYGDNPFILPVGSYNYLLWIDKNKDLECNPGEDIINYYYGVDVNAQLCNTVVVKKSKKQEKNSPNTKTILSE